jgi:hypothetical protein
MTKFEIKKGWMNIVWNLSDGIVLNMTVRDLKEILSQISDSSEELHEDE